MPTLQGITVTGGTLYVGALMSVPPIGLAAPVPPSNVQVVAVSGGRVDVSWTDQSTNELGFKRQYGEICGPQHRFEDDLLLPRARLQCGGNVGLFQRGHCNGQMSCESAGA